MVHLLLNQAGPCCAPGRNALYVCSSLSPAAFLCLHGSPKCHISIQHLVFIAHTGCCQSAIKQQRFTIVIVQIVESERGEKIQLVQATLLLLYCGQKGSPRPCSFSVSSGLIERCATSCACCTQHNSANMIWITLFLLYIFPHLLALPNTTVVSLFHTAFLFLCFSSIIPKIIY